VSEQHTHYPYIPLSEVSPLPAAHHASIFTYSSPFLLSAVPFLLLPQPCIGRRFVEFPQRASRPSKQDTDFLFSPPFYNLRVLPLARFFGKNGRGKVMGRSPFGKLLLHLSSKKSVRSPLAVFAGFERLFPFFFATSFPELSFGPQLERKSFFFPSFLYLP